MAALSSVVTVAASYARRLAAHAPALRAKELVYDRAYYASMDEVHRPMYEALADATVEAVRPRTAVDVGCGTGTVLARLRERGVDVTGLEGSRHAIELSPVRDRIRRVNLERGVPRVGRFDVCICIEVAEHLPARAAKTLVSGLAALSDVVVFTAAPPGQGGAHHVNEQPQEYWNALFAAAGLQRETRLEAALKERIAGIEQPAWMRANLMAFARGA